MHLHSFQSPRKYNMPISSVLITAYFQGKQKENTKSHSYEEAFSNILQVRLNTSSADWWRVNQTNHGARKESVVECRDYGFFNSCVFPSSSSSWSSSLCVLFLFRNFPIPEKKKTSGPLYHFSTPFSRPLALPSIKNKKCVIICTSAYSPHHPYSLST